MLLLLFSVLSCHSHSALELKGTRGSCSLTIEYSLKMEELKLLGITEIP